MIFFFWIYNYDIAKIGSLQQPIFIKIKTANFIHIEKGPFTTYKISLIGWKSPVFFECIVW